MPHYGDPAPAVALVRQLLAQRTGLALEVIIVDDASPILFPSTTGVTVVRRPVNGGFGAAVNTGAAAAEGRLLMVLNSDLTVSDTFVTDWVERSRAWMPAVTGPLVVTPDGVQEWTGRRDPSVTQQFVEWLALLARWRYLRVLQWLVGRNPACRPGATQVVDWLSGAALLLPADEFRDVGGFDEQFFMFCEETDLQQRLRRLGVPSVFLGEVEVTHVGGASTDPGRRREWLVAARMRQAHLAGTERRLRLALITASWINLLWNVGRSVLGRDTRPVATFRHEVRLAGIPRRDGRHTGG